MITIKIPTAIDFWHAVAKFAYRRYIRRSEDNGVRPVGIPGNRDPQNPCTAFVPSRASGFRRDCEGDGHYLCRECALLRRDEPEVPRG